MSLRMVVGGAALIALAACGEGGDGKGGAKSGNTMSGKMQPGQWEVTQEMVKMEMPGVPAEALKGQLGQKSTSRNCITPKDIEKADSDFLSPSQQKNCKSSGFSMANGKISGSTTCTSEDMPGSSTMTVNGSYTATTYEVTMVMSSQGAPAGRGMSMEARASGKRIGECTPEQAAEAAADEKEEADSKAAP